MRFIPFILIFMSSLSFAAEYGYFHRADSSDTTSWTPESITLNEGDRFVLLRADGEYFDNTYRNYSSEYTTKRNPFTAFTISNDIFIRDIQLYSSHFFQNQHISGNDGGHAYSHIDYTNEDVRTIPGPCIVTPLTSGSNGTWVPYKIIRVSEEEGGSKFTASLNSDGSRLAIGSKTPGSNAVTRVYEFDGSSWNQLGEDVE